jgi:nucleotide-binding universal stress UspA family protein
MISSIVTPERRRSIWITTSCLLCEGAARLLGLVGARSAKERRELAEESERRKAAEELVAFLQRYKLDDKGSDYRIEEGDAVDVITRAVDELRSDLLVVGTHGRTGISKLLLGSVAETVVCKIEVDILVVPATSD